MALLSEAKRKQYFSDLGLGNYNATNIKKFQKGAFPNNSKEWDGIYGTKTDNALRHWWNVRKYTKNFKPEEFRCGCGGKYCTGYPTYMRKEALQHIQSIRDMYGKPITVTCGLRCKTYNSKLSGSIGSSLHLSGLAIDFYQQGVTDTLANRKASIKKIKVLPNHHYTYGNGINSNGASVKATYMGNCLHTDVSQKSSTTASAPATSTTTSNANKILAACKTQADWMKNAKYGSYSPVTLAHSKKAGTCVTYVGCVFQRVGALASGKYVWHNGKGYGTGKVSGVNKDKMTVTYMGNKKLSALKSTIKPGDCILLDDNKSGKKGSGGHVFFATGEWSGSDPYIWDMESSRKCVKTGKKRKYNGNRKVLAIVRLK